MKNIRRVAAMLLLTPLLVLYPYVPAAGTAVTPVPDMPLAKNVIVMVADGGGFNHFEAGSIWDTGERQGEIYNDFPFQFAVSTYSWGEALDGGCEEELGSYDPAAAWESFDYVLGGFTDSAAAATAMSSGVKTYNSGIGVDCNGDEVKHVAERADELGKATGFATSVQWTHATPAGFFAHADDRGTREAIADDMINSGFDVIMGAGHPEFNIAGAPRPTPAYGAVGSEAIWQSLHNGTAGADHDADGDGVGDPWTPIEERADFQALAQGTTPTRVLGTAEVFSTLQQDRAGLRSVPPFTVPLNQNVPTLEEMALGAINVLDNDPDGFFLLVEGGAIDLAAHDGRRPRMVEEIVGFNRAIDAVYRWVETYSNWGETLLVVTADHETGYLVGPQSGQTASGPVWNPIVNNGAGVQPGMVLTVTTHTNSLVPLYAKGAAGRLFRWTVDGYDPRRGRYIDNTDIADVLFEAIE